MCVEQNSSSGMGRALLPEAGAVLCSSRPCGQCQFHKLLCDSSLLCFFSLFAFSHSLLNEALP